MASNFRAFLALAAVFSVSGAVASTPDGQTPSEETICDGYSGAAFGLCNAYCEAMDCDADPNADQQACDTVGAKFAARTGHDLPCEGKDWACEDAGNLKSNDAQAPDGYLACNDNGTTVFCDLAQWDLYGASSKYCQAPAPTCSTYFGEKGTEFDASVCKQAPTDTQIACDIGEGVAYYCDTAKGSTPEACFATSCPTTVR